MANVAVLGYGTVGSGVVEALSTNSTTIAAGCGEPVELKYVLEIRDFPGDPVEKYLVRDIDTILEDESVKVVVEVMGGLEPAFTFVKRALEKGKSVVTSNKELVAARGAQLLAIARENSTNFMFEASVGGGIPIIRPLSQSLASEDIYEIKGILNGTTNYILTKMKKNGESFEEALKAAQEKGYAERRPDADILGLDSARKIAILSSLAFGGQVDFEEIYTEGITSVTYNDMLYAEKMNGVIKLVAESKKTDSGFTARVCPVILPADSPLSNVDGVFNAITVKGNIIGEVMFYGMGAGKLPTASAVVSDVVECVKNYGKSVMNYWTEEKITPAGADEVVSTLLIRFAENAADKQKSEIHGFFPEFSVLGEDLVSGEFAIVASGVKESVLKSAKERFGGGMLNWVRIDETAEIKI